MTSARVLIVDDNVTVRTLLTQALRQHGFDVFAADSGPAALRIAVDVCPAVAVIDQWMPEMTGAELIRLLRSAPIPELRAMAIIGLSGRSGSERDLLGAGADGFIAKPFGELELVAAVRTALGQDVPTSGAA